MKTLLLLRHAKSDWGDPSLDDHARPLNDRGRDAAQRVAAWLTETGLELQQILCSSARRTRETLDAIPAARRGAVAIESELYLASWGALLDRLARVDEEIDTLLLIGHNPGIADLAHQLAGEGRAEALSGLRRKYPTGALARLHFETDRWCELAPRTGWLESFVTPRMLASKER